MLVRLGFPALDAYLLDIAKQLDNLLGTIAHCDMLAPGWMGAGKENACTVDALVLALVVYIVKVAEHFDS